MKRLRTALTGTLLLALGATLAHAQTGMNLAWNNCITQPNAAADKAYACDGSMNGTPFKIVLSFFTPIELPKFVGIQATIDIRTSTGTLPDWWQLGGSQCRAGNLAFRGSAIGVGTGATGACRTPWAGANSGGGFHWSSPIPDDSLNQGRLVIALARDVECALGINQQYVGGIIELDTFNDIESGYGVCSGCATPVCIVLNQVQLFQTAGAQGGDIQTITLPEARQWITWQGGSCGLVTPARTMWGSIRAIYQ
jgi:hypothetical protein